MGSHDHRGKASKPFVYFWESLTSNEGGRERAHCILKPINEYHRRAKKILEIDCGIGEVLINLPEVLINLPRTPFEVKLNPLFDEITSDPRFDELMKKTLRSLKTT